MSPYIECQARYYPAVGLQMTYTEAWVDYSLDYRKMMSAGQQFTEADAGGSGKSNSR